MMHANTLLCRHVTTLSCRLDDLALFFAALTSDEQGKHGKCRLQEKRWSSRGSQMHSTTQLHHAAALVVLGCARTKDCKQLSPRPFLKCHSVCHASRIQCYDAQVSVTRCPRDRRVILLPQSITGLLFHAAASSLSSRQSHALCFCTAVLHYMLSTSNNKSRCSACAGAAPGFDMPMLLCSIIVIHLLPCSEERPTLTPRCCATWSRHGSLLSTSVLIWLPWIEKTRYVGSRSSPYINQAPRIIQHLEKKRKECVLMAWELCTLANLCSLEDWHAAAVIRRLACCRHMDMLPCSKGRGHAATFSRSSRLAAKDMGMLPHSHGPAALQQRTWACCHV
eukprot:1156546-Pelagomonas_calceolata.AAC.9